MPTENNNSNTSVGSSTHNNNVFLTTENLAFAMPLILLCSVYAYFQFVPLRFAIPILLGVAFLGWLRHLWRKRNDHKLTHLDEKTIQDLVGDMDDDDDNDNNHTKQKEKARNRLKNRIAQERKARNRRGASNNDGDDDDDDDPTANVSAFVNTKKKGK